MYLFFHRRYGVFKVQSLSKSHSKSLLPWPLKKLSRFQIKGLILKLNFKKSGTQFQTKLQFSLPYSYEHRLTNLKYCIGFYFIIPDWFSSGGDSKSFGNSFPVLIRLFPLDATVVNLPSNRINFSLHIFVSKIPNFLGSECYFSIA